MPLPLLNNEPINIDWPADKVHTFKDDAFPSPSIGLVAGCFKGGQEGWAGQANLEWWKGVVIKRNK